MKKFDITSLRPIELSDKKRFDTEIWKMDSQSSECSFTNLYAYQPQRGIEFVECDGRLVVYERNKRLLHYPLGRWTNPKLLRDICDAFMEAGLSDGEVYDVPEEFLDKHADCDAYFDLEFDEGQVDYLFSVEKISGFVGPKLRKKHNLVKQFQSSWPYAEVKPITPEEIPVVSKLALELNGRLERCPYFEEEEVALERCWKDFQILGLSGIVLYAEPDFPVGFSVYSGLSADTVDVHFEKADHSVKGAGQTLTWQLAVALRGRAKFMNREKDWNEETLRHNKRSLDPERFFKRYFLRRNGKND